MEAALIRDQQQEEQSGLQLLAPQVTETKH
jgi:hypothetical protein